MKGGRIQLQWVHGRNLSRVAATLDAFGYPLCMECALGITPWIGIAAVQRLLPESVTPKDVRPPWDNRLMFETTPPQSSPELPAGIDLSDLDDPTTGVIAVELSHLVVRLCMRSAEPLVSDLAAKEGFLRQDGGPEVASRLFAMRMFQQIDAAVYYQLRCCVPRDQIAAAQARTEELLRAQLADVVGTAVSYLLSDGRDTAIQMTAVAATMAGKEVAAAMPAVISEFQPSEQER